VTTLDEFLTTVEAASALELHPQTIKRLCRLGKLLEQNLTYFMVWLVAFGLEFFNMI
jgi:hypothetical protein